MAESANIEPYEIKKFEELAKSWWDPEGPMRSLHAINPLRLNFIREETSLRGKKILDIGCGVGLLTEALAREGVHVIGIDPSPELLEVAIQHARMSGLEINYRLIDSEQMAKEQAHDFDLVTCMEVLEHVPEPTRVLGAISKLLTPAGHAYISTVDRSVKSLLFAIAGGEYILRLLPKGSHTYQKLIRPAELRQWANQNDLIFRRMAGLIYNPFRNQFSLVKRAGINYMMDFIRS